MRTATIFATINEIEKDKIKKTLIRFRFDLAAFLFSIFQVYDENRGEIEPICLSQYRNGDTISHNSWYHPLSDSRDIYFACLAGSGFQGVKHYTQNYDWRQLFKLAVSGMKKTGMIGLDGDGFTEITGTTQDSCF